MSKTLHRNLQAKMEALQGPEWDSSDEDEAKVIIKADSKATKKKKGATKSKTSKKTSKSKTVEEEVEEDEGDGTVLYIGHLPNEFEERDLKNFLNQFGNVINIRISRSVKSGNSRGYAFCRYEDAETAKIVAETLQGYFLGKRRLVCQVVPNPHKSMFFNTDKIIARRAVQKEVQAKKRQRDLANAQKLKVITARLVSREQKKRAKLAALGIDYDFPGIDGGDDNEAMEEDQIPSEEEETPKKLDKKKKKRKDSIDSTGSSSSRKRKDSIGSEASSKSSKKSKRKDSMDTIESTEQEEEALSTPKKAAGKERSAASEKKKKDKKKQKKRRVSAP